MAEEYIDSKYLDEKTRERLHRILAKSEPELTDEEFAFLRARSVYVKEKHKELFPTVFSKKGNKRAEDIAEKEQNKVDIEDPKPENPFEENQEEEELLG